MVRIFALALAAVLAGAPLCAQEAAAPERTPSAAEILANARAAVEKAGAVKASVRLEVWYPFHYESSIELVAAPGGDERAEITTEINGRVHKALRVRSGRVVWNQTETAEGPVVSRIDESRVAKALGGAFEDAVARRVIGTNALYDAEGLGGIIDFAQVREELIDSRETFVVSGSRKAGIAVPETLARFYSKASLYFDAQSFLCRRIDLGAEDEHPLVRMDVTAIETNYAVPEGAFAYVAPLDIPVIDRTQWAIDQLKSR